MSTNLEFDKEAVCRLAADYNGSIVGSTPTMEIYIEFPMIIHDIDFVKSLTEASDWVAELSVLSDCVDSLYRRLHLIVTPPKGTLPEIIKLAKELNLPIIGNEVDGWYIKKNGFIVRVSGGNPTWIYSFNVKDDLFVELSFDAARVYLKAMKHYAT